MDGLRAVVSCPSSACVHGNQTVTFANVNPGLEVVIVCLSLGASSAQSAPEHQTSRSNLKRLPPKALIYEMRQPNKSPASRERGEDVVNLEDEEQQADCAMLHCAT